MVKYNGALLRGEMARGTNQRRTLLLSSVGLFWAIVACGGGDGATEAADPASGASSSADPYADEVLGIDLPEPPKPSTAKDPEGNEFVIDQIVVTKASSVSEEVFEDAVVDMGGSVVPVESEPDRVAMQVLGLRRVLLPEDVTVEQAKTALLGANVADAAEADYVVPYEAAPNDTLLHQLWGMDQIRAADAWDIQTGSQDVIVAVLDTGFSPGHPDLRSNLYTNPGEVANNNLDDDGNGYVDDVHGWDMISGDARPEDGQGHGTHVSGTIGAVGNNGLGVAGVNWRVSILPI